jgi:hypothetical protein
METAQILQGAHIAILRPIVQANSGISQCAKKHTAGVGVYRGVQIRFT